MTPSTLPKRTIKREILKECMSVKYCRGTRFEYLDPEERIMIYNAMEIYKAHSEKEKNVTNQTGFTPKELAKQNEKLKEALQYVDREIENCVIQDFFDMSQIKQALKQAK